MSNRENDAEEIGDTLKRATEASLRGDARLLEGLYAPDAEWTDALGTTVEGNAAITAHLRGTFASRRVVERDRRLPARLDVRVRPVTDDVVVARTYVEFDPKEGAHAGPPVRRSHSMKVLRRTAGGRWSIVSEMSFDDADHWFRPARADA